MGATHIIVSDCRLVGRVRAPADSCMVWIRPSIRVTGSLWSPREGLLATVRDGETAVTGDVLRVVTGWLEGGSRRLSRGEPGLTGNLTSSTGAPTTFLGTRGSHES